MPRANLIIRTIDCKGSTTTFRLHNSWPIKRMNTTWNPPTFSLLPLAGLSLRVALRHSLFHFIMIFGMIQQNMMYSNVPHNCNTHFNGFNGYSLFWDSWLTKSQVPILSGCMSHTVLNRSRNSTLKKPRLFLIKKGSAKLPKNTMPTLAIVSGLKNQLTKSVGGLWCCSNLIITIEMNAFQLLGNLEKIRIKKQTLKCKICSKTFESA